MALRKHSGLDVSLRKRLFFGLVGILIVYWIMDHVGLAMVFQTIFQSLSVFPAIFILEFLILTCNVWALRMLYEEDRKNIPIAQLVRCGLIGYSVMGLLPAGRTLAESTRAYMLTPYSSAPKAVAAGTYLQGISLLANSAISVPATFATFYSQHFALPTLLIFGNCIITGVLGFSILFTARNSQIGRRLGRYIPQIRQFGPAFDAQFASRKFLPSGPFFCELLGRVLQVVQNGVLLLAVHAQVGLQPALCSEALHLVGAAVGDLIPGQLGATELNYQLSAHILGVRPAEAVAIAILAHIAQLLWVVVGLLVAAFWVSAKTPHTNTIPIPK